VYTLLLFKVQALYSAAKEETALSDKLLINLGLVYHLNLTQVDEGPVETDGAAKAAPPPFWWKLQAWFASTFLY